MPELVIKPWDIEYQKRIPDAIKVQRSTLQRTFLTEDGLAQFIDGLFKEKE